MEIISAISLENSNTSYIDKENNTLERIEPISKINIFVGANNSGKSRLMRYLFCKNDYNVLIEGIDLHKENLQIISCIETIEEMFIDYNITQVNNISINTFTKLRILPEYFHLRSDVYDSIRSEFSTLSTFPKITSVSGMGAGDFAQQETFKKTISQNALASVSVLDRIPRDLGLQDLKSFYIPVLRGLRPILEQNTNDIYKDRTIKDYFSEFQNKSVNIFSGMDFFTRLTNLLLGKKSERKLIIEYQNFLSKTLFENQNVELIPNQTSNTVVVKIGKEQEQPIHHLGDGIQSIIILTFLPFVTQEPAFFFIEEPEIFLHPGMQRKIMEFFSSNEGNLKKHTFFLTTHSNHFLDITIDYPNVSIFNFRKQLPEGDGDEKEAIFIFEAVDIGSKSTLECLGVRNSSVFLVNATIWVEGITDRWYLREMLQKYMKLKDNCGNDRINFEEDVHYSFVEYGGSNITHWSFLDYEEHPIEVENLCGKALVIVDKDGGTKLKRKEKLQEFLGDRLIILPCREIENLLPYSIIKNIILEYESNNKELPDDNEIKYQNKKLGEFIEDKILKGVFTRKGGYKGESGTIKGKVDFCKKALPMINEYDLTDSALSVVSQIYEFIKKQNQ